MIKVTFTKPVETLRSTTQLYQWDTGQSLEIGGLGDCGTPDIHFTFHGMKFAYVVKSESVGGKLYVEIPNKILMYGKDVIVYICTEVSGVKSTLASVVIPVIKRNMPSDYFYNAEDDELATVDRLLAETERATEVETNHEQRISNIETNHGNRITSLETFKTNTNDQLKNITTENESQHNDLETQINEVESDLTSMSTDYENFKKSTNTMLSSEIATREILSNQVGTMSTSLDDVTAEVVQARVDFGGNGHSTLKDRLDTEFGGIKEDLNYQINERIIGDATENFDATKIDIESIASGLNTKWNSSTFALGCYADFQGKTIKSITFVGIAGKTMKVMLYDSATAEPIIGGTTKRTIVKEIPITTDGLQTHEINVFCPSNKVFAVNCPLGAKYKGSATTGSKQDCYMITSSGTSYQSNLTLGLGVEFCTYSAIKDCQNKIEAIDSRIERNTVKYKTLYPSEYDNKLAKILLPVMGGVDVSSGWTDFPSGITSGILINYKGNGSSILQTLHTYEGRKSPQIYSRVITSTSAESWTYIGKVESSNSIMYQTLNASDYDGKTAKILFPYMGNLAKSVGWTDLPRSDMGQGVIVNLKGLNNVFLQLCFDFGENRTYQRVISSASEGVWAEIKAIPSTSIKTYTTGKKCGCLGDSITYGLRGTSWVTKLSEYCGFSEVVNYGVSGSQISGKYPEGMLNRYSSMRDDLDYIVVWGGVNDFMWSIDSKDIFRTNYENLIVGLLNKFPAAKILGITPMKFEFTETAEGIRSRKWSAARTDGIVLKDYRDIEIEILDKYSIPCLDLYSCSGISPEIPAQANTYFHSTQDHLHPNTNGNIKILAPKIAEALKRL